MSEPTKQLWKVKDVAAYLNLSEKAVYRRVERDTIPYLKMGESLRFDPDDIDDWLRENGP
ncbi:MAG: helix-turn-helix transcriptional regulator [Gemmatimonadota bacterium]